MSIFFTAGLSELCVGVPLFLEYLMPIESTTKVGDDLLEELWSFCRLDEKSFTPFECNCCVIHDFESKEILEIF